MKFFNYRLAKYFKKITLFTSFGLLIPQIVFAVNPLINILGDLILRVVMIPFYFALQLEVFILPLVASYNKFGSEAGVIIGWVALRDLVNMFFILILLVIAFATIINVSSYGYRQLLSRMIIVAILINFSRTIVGFAIDITQVIMLTFVFAISDVAAGNIMVSLGLHKITSSGNSLDLGNYIVALILGGVMLAIAVVVIGVIIIMLTMRIVHLWIAMVLSPVAFFAFIFPSAKKFYVKWSQDLGKNLISGPILAFFLWLAFTITGRGDIADSFNNTQENDAIVQEAPAIDAPSEALSVNNVINYVIAISLLVGGLQMAAASGAAGASFASKGMGMVQKGAGYMGRNYALAPASRLGAFASRGLIKSDGSARGQKLFGKIGWNNVPFWGGRVQRTAMRMQGYDADRIQKKKEDDQRGIKDTHRIEYAKSRSTISSLEPGQKLENWAASRDRIKRSLGKVGVGVVKGALPLYSSVSSIGGNADHDTVLAQTLVDRGEVENADQASWVNKQLAKVGDQTRQDKHNLQWGNEVSEEDALRYVDDLHHNLFKNLKSESILDKAGNSFGGIKNLFKAFRSDEYADGIGTANSLLGKVASRQLRVKLAQASAQEDVDDELEDHKFMSTVDEDGQRVAQFTNKDQIALDSNNGYIKQLTFESGLYPQMAVPRANRVVSDINKAITSGEIGLPKDFYKHLRQSVGESDEQFTERKERVKAQALEETRAYEAIPKDKRTAKDREKLYRNRRLMAGYFTDDEANNNLASIDTREQSLESAYKNKKISKETYKRNKAEISEQRRNILSSPLKLIDVEDEESVLKVALEDKLGSAPEITVDKSDSRYEEQRQRVADYEKQKGEIAKEIRDGFKSIDGGADAKRLEELPALIANASSISEKRKFERERDTLFKAQSSRRRDISGIQIDSGRDYAAGAMVREVSDGMDYSRLHEMDISKGENRELFKDFARHATQDQQRHILQEGTPEQIRLFAETLARTGKKVNKIIMDNLEPAFKKELATLVVVQNAIKDGMDREAARAHVASKSPKDIIDSIK
ncbi:hypothetical protein KKH39_02265 [Patescibacteria group bacterium]|nr:hypothetical protein [Patescibacteria group bacterium]